MLIHQGWFTALYSQDLLASQSFEFESCILQALNMPLIRCANVLFQGRLFRHTSYYFFSLLDIIDQDIFYLLYIIMVKPVPCLVFSAKILQVFVSEKDVT